MLDGEVGREVFGGEFVGWWEGVRGAVGGFGEGEVGGEEVADYA